MGNKERCGMGNQIREGFLEELDWSTMGDNPGGKNSVGQGIVVGMSLAGSRDRRESGMVGAE